MCCSSSRTQHTHGCGVQTAYLGCEERRLKSLFWIQIQDLNLSIPKLQVEMMLTGKAPSFPPSLVTPLRPVTACLAANQCTFLSSLNILTTSKGYMCR